MNAEKVLSTMNQIAEKYAEHIAQTPEFEALAQSLREEISLAEQKKAGRADRFKAALRFSKKCNKEQKTSRPSMAGAWMDAEGRQCILHPHMAVRYETPFEGLVEAEEGKKPNLDRMLDKYDSSRKCALPDLGHLKAALKLDKAEGRLDNHGNSLYALDGVKFNTDYLIQLVEMVEPTEAYFSNKDKYPMLVAFGKGSAGILCPVREF